MRFALDCRRYKPSESYGARECHGGVQDRGIDWVQPGESQKENGDAGFEERAAEGIKELGEDKIFCRANIARLPGILVVVRSAEAVESGENGAKAGRQECKLFGVSWRDSAEEIDLLAHAATAQPSSQPKPFKPLLRHVRADIRRIMTTEDRAMKKTATIMIARPRP